jgi:hypothetical protein
VAALGKNNIPGALLTAVKDTADNSAFCGRAAIARRDGPDRSPEVAHATGIRAFASLICHENLVSNRDSIRVRIGPRFGLVTSPMSSLRTAASTSPSTSISRSLAAQRPMPSEWPSAYK